MEYKSLAIKDFIDSLNSSAPVPGGGGTAALCGSLGAALGGMVGALTVGKKKYADVQDRIAELNAGTTALIDELLGGIEKDAKAFEPLAAAYHIPKEDPTRDEVMEAALVTASEPPLEIMRNCCKAIEYIEEYAKIGMVSAVSDAGCGALLASAALKAASLNVLINAKSMKNREVADKLKADVENMISEYERRANAVYEAVRDKF